jgi:type I restriction enzyme R subunit
VRSGDFWRKVLDQRDVTALEGVREELRGIVRHRVVGPTGGTKPRILDIKEDAARIEYGRHMPKLEGAELVAYRQRVEQVLTGLFDTNSTCARFAAAMPRPTWRSRERCSPRRMSI